MKNNPFEFKRGYGTQEDNTTMCVPVIQIEHAAVHKGKAFTSAGIMTVPNTKTGGLFLKVPGDRATYTFNMTAATSDLTFTAVDVGAAGNDITVTVVDPGGVTATLGVTVVGTAITINLGRTASAIDSTAAAVKTLVNADPIASLLVTCEDEGTGTGLVNAMTVQSLAGGTDKSYCHFNAMSIHSTAAVTVSLLEQYTKAPGDTVGTVTPKNCNRISTDASTITLTGGTDVTPTQATGYNTLATTSVSAGETKKLGGASSTTHEWILNTGYNYCIAIANASGGNAVISYDLFWYEI